MTVVSEISNWLAVCRFVRENVPSGLVPYLSMVPCCNQNFIPVSHLPSLTIRIMHQNVQVIS